jgi:hypothetical protein
MEQAAGVWQAVMWLYGEDSLAGVLDLWQAMRPLVEHPAVVTAANRVVYGTGTTFDSTRVADVTFLIRTRLAVASVAVQGVLNSHPQVVHALFAMLSDHAPQLAALRELRRAAS